VDVAALLNAPAKTLAEVKIKTLDDTLGYVECETLDDTSTDTLEYADSHRDILGNVQAKALIRRLALADTSVEHKAETLGDTMGDVKEKPLVNTLLTSGKGNNKV